MKNNGFTLIELMITITVAAILLMIAIPNMQTLVNENRITTRTNELITDLMVAKSESIRRGIRAVVCIRNAGGTDCNTGGAWQDGWIVFMDNDADGTVDAAEEIIRVHEAFPAGITLGGIGAAGAGIVTYVPSGNVVAIGTFTLCRTGLFGRTIAISSTGRTTTTKTAAVCT